MFTLNIKNNNNDTGDLPLQKSSLKSRLFQINEYCKIYKIKNKKTNINC